MDIYEIALATLFYGVEEYKKRVQISIEIPMGQDVLKKSKEYKELFFRASQLSGRGDKKERTEQGKGEDLLLSSVFSSVGKKDSTTKRMYYHPVKLGYHDNIFPKEYSFNSFKSSKEDIRKILESLSLQAKTISSGASKELQFNLLLGALENHLSFLPAFEKEDSDISLFDYIKCTAAVAACIHHNKENCIKDQYLILEGDVSGIQSFIFGVTEGEETRKNVSKILRGRSLYINFLAEFLSKYICKEIGLPTCNILYCGGGKFRILTPGGPDIIKSIEKISIRIQKLLYQKHKTALGVVFGYAVINDDDIKHFDNALLQLDRVMTVRKQQKFKNIIMEDETAFFSIAKGNYKKCRYCDNESVDNLCDQCQVDIHLGTGLAGDEIKYLYYDFDTTSNKGQLEIDFSPLGRIGFMSSPPSENSFYSIENINERGNLGRIKFLGNKVPMTEGVVASFNDLAELSQGDKKIGILKMDVDNLGTIFTGGFTKEKRTIARISTLSRLMELYFCGYINVLNDKVSSKYLNENKHVTGNSFYTNYSGGDDLLIIGPWDGIIELAGAINEDFHQYTCNNEGITLSAGIHLCSSKEPIRTTSELAEEKLERSKGVERKNSLTIFEDTIPWDGAFGLSKALRDSEEYRQWIEGKKLSRTLMFDLLIASKGFINNEGKPNLDLIPLIAYSIARNVKDDTVKKSIFERVVTRDINNKELDFIHIPIMISMMKTRVREEK